MADQPEDIFTIPKRSGKPIKIPKVNFKLSRSVQILVLLLVLVNSLWPRRRRYQEDVVVEESKQIVEMKIGGMRCNGCVQSLTRALGECRGVSEVEVRLEDGSATIQGRDFSHDDLTEAVTSLGFTVE